MAGGRIGSLLRYGIASKRPFHMFSYRITGLDPTPFRPLFGLPNAELLNLGVHRMPVEEKHSMPDRIALRDAEPGETVLLLNHVYLDSQSPYRGCHAIFVREWSDDQYDRVDEIPDTLKRRLISLRAFDENAMMVDAEVSEGEFLEALIQRLLVRPDVAFLHAHNARRGCFAARIERADKSRAAM
jgi:hypothetical protein